ncbi:MAG TPA: hypothetical protein VGD81_01235 [Opitutaceae bacterium]
MNATFPGILLDRISPPDWLLSELPDGSYETKADVYRAWIEVRAIGFSRSDLITGRAERQLHAAQYRVLIHEAVLRSRGHCFYSGRALAWGLIRMVQDPVDRPALFPAITHDGIDDHGFPILQLASTQVSRVKSDLTLGAAVETLVLSFLRLPIRWWRSLGTERLRESVIRDAYREPAIREKPFTLSPYATFQQPSWSNH